MCIRDSAGEVEEDEYQESQCRCLREVAACQQLAGEVHGFLVFAGQLCDLARLRARADLCASVFRNADRRLSVRPADNGDAAFRQVSDLDLFARSDVYKRQPY